VHGRDRLTGAKIWIERLDVRLLSRSISELQQKKAPVCQEGNCSTWKRDTVTYSYFFDETCR
jgi:hypothetical protein